MPRPKIRLSPAADSNFLVMLRNAVIDDKSKSTEWKSEVVHHLSALIILFVKK